MCQARARAQGNTCQHASSRPPPHPRLHRRPEPERARLRHPRPVPDRGAPDAPRPPAGALAGLQHYPTRCPGLRVPLGRSAWPPPCPACADGRPGHRGPLLSHPTRTPDPLPGARLLVPLDGALAPPCYGISRGLEVPAEKVKNQGWASSLRLRASPRLVLFLHARTPKAVPPPSG